MAAAVLFFAGLALLIAGAEMLVRGASRIATTLGIPPMVIGLTIVALGTSMPELAVGIAAGLDGKGELGVGNIAGANLFVMLVVIGLSAVMRPLPLHLQVFKLELPMIVIAALLLTALAWDGVLSRLDGFLMFLVGLGYTALLFRATSKASRRSQREYSEEYGPESVPPKRSAWYGVRNAALLIVGIGLTVFGAELLVRGAITIAERLGVSAAIIGLTVVAIGTSAPELVTTIVSTIKNDRDVAVGNILGSGIYNILIILAIVCMVTPGGLPVERQLLSFDIPLMAGVAVGAIPIFYTGNRISRLEGALGIAIYIAYVTWLCLQHIGD